MIKGFLSVFHISPNDETSQLLTTNESAVDYTVTTLQSMTTNEKATKDNISSTEMMPEIADKGKSRLSYLIAQMSQDYCIRAYITTQLLFSLLS